MFFLPNKINKIWNKKNQPHDPHDILLPPMWEWFPELKFYLSRGKKYSLTNYQITTVL